MSGNRGQPQIGFLKADATGLKAQDGLCRDALAVVFSGEFQCRSHFRAGDFTHAAALKGAFDGNHDGRFASDGAFGDDHAIVSGRNDVLGLKPG